MPGELSFGAERLVEGDRGLIPVEDGPFHATATALVGEFGEVQEEGFAEAASSEFGFHEKVFEVEAGFGEERGVVGEEDGEAGGGWGGVVGEGEDAFGGGFFGEQRGAEFLLGRFDLVGEFLVVGEGADEFEDEREVGGRGGADHGAEVCGKMLAGVEAPSVNRIERSAQMEVYGGYPDDFMKIRNLRNSRAAWMSAILGAAMLMCSGCVAVVAAGAAGAAAVAWVRGELQTTLPANLDRSFNASNEAIEELQFVKVSERKDALLGVIVARNAADKKIEIKLENMAGNVTKVGIRVGVVGDQELSLAILEKIKANL